MGLKFWYVVDGHHIFQTKQFSLKISLWLVSYEVLDFSHNLGSLNQKLHHINFSKKPKIMPYCLYLYEHGKI